MKYLLPLLCLLSACTSYNQRTDAALRAFEGGRFEEAIVAYTEDGTNTFLPAAEAGMIALAAGDWERALEYLGRAAEIVEEIEDEALISPENAGEQLLGWTINDTFSEYYGEGYERVMLHACLGLAYLAQGRVESVHVEVKRANRLLEGEEELYESSYQAGGLGHLLSALAYELTGDFDDAYIDYKRLEQKGLGGELTGRALVRLATWLGRDDELPEWEGRYGPDVARPENPASVILIAGVGLGPHKQENRLDIAHHSGLISWAVPTFAVRSQLVSGLVLSTQDVEVQTVVVEDVGAVATRNLDDRLAWLAAKSAVRSWLKLELTQHLEEEHGAAGAIAGILFTAITEQADLRAWRTLPDTWQAARLFLPAGEHDLSLAAIGGDYLPLGRYELEPGETMFVLVRTLGPRVYASPIGGRSVPIAEPEEL